jgi:hypothetical protein
MARASPAPSWANRCRLALCGNGADSFCRLLLLRDIDAELTPQDQLGAAVEANLRWSMHQLLDTAEGRARMAEGILKLVGAIYELKTSHVRFLS